MKLYFERHDGQAVTCDDFAQAIADANPDSPLAARLDDFKRWYSQTGTPRLKAVGNYDASARSYTLTLSQSLPARTQAQSEPFVIPVRIGLLGADGSEIVSAARTHVLASPQGTLVFDNIEAQPVPSILRGFSAPVILDYNYTDDELLTLLAHDSDPFNRWDAGQRLLLNRAIGYIRSDAPATGALVLDAACLDAMRRVLRHDHLDAAFKELALTLPSETYIAEQLDVVDPQRVHGVREAMREQLAQALHADWMWAWETHHDNGAYRTDTVSSGRRALAGMALSMLCVAARHSGDAVWPGKAYQRSKHASNMTERFGALSALVGSGQALATPALQKFHALFKDEALVLDKWFALQASTPDHHGQVLLAVQKLMKHADFSLRNPNRARSVIFSYCSGNPGGFHRADGTGYRFWQEQVLALDAINPQVAARLARALDRWRKLAEPWRNAAQQAIRNVAAAPELSKDLREVVSRALAD